MAKGERFEMRVTARWLQDVDEARNRLGIRSRSSFAYLATEAVARRDVIPAPLLAEAASAVEDVREVLSADKRHAGLVEMLDDAIHIITAAEGGELPEDLVWNNGR